MDYPQVHLNKNNYVVVENPDNGRLHGIVFMVSDNQKSIIIDLGSREGIRSAGGLAVTRYLPLIHEGEKFTDLWGNDWKVSE